MWYEGSALVAGCAAACLKEGEEGRVDPAG